MKLSKNSLAARWYIHLTGGLPKSLCPFFWNTLLSIPLGLLFFAGFITKYTRMFNADTDTGKIMNRFGLGFLIELIIVSIGALLYQYVLSWMNYTSNTAIGTGIVLGAIGVFIFILYRVEQVKRKRKKNSITPSTWEVCKVAVRSWYERNCPIIDWQE